MNIIINTVNLLLFIFNNKRQFVEIGLEVYLAQIVKAKDLARVILLQVSFSNN